MMIHLGRPPGFANLTAWQARGVLLIALATAAFLVGITFSPLKSGFADAPDRGPSDVGLYNAEITRIGQGESYYDAASIELRERGYPTRSIFNWRTPLPMWLIGGLLSVSFGQSLLGIAALALMVMSFELMNREGNLRQAAICLLWLSGALMPCILSEVFVMPELWCGVFIALSAVAYGLGYVKTGVTTGLVSLFLRELAAPYCLICFVLAARQHRQREMLGWAAGFAMYAIFYAVHLSRVLPLIRPDDIVHENGWVRFGGAGFVISTAQMNTYLLLLPQWVTALYLTAALVGAAGWQSRAGQRIGLTLATYLIIFSVVGNDFNQYWGSLTAPLFCLAASRFPTSAGELWSIAKFRHRSGAAHLASLEN